MFEGDFGSCSGRDPFEIWNETYKMKDYDESLNYLMKFFDVPTFTVPSGGKDVQRFINEYFYAKYGLFTCYDMQRNFGHRPPNFTVIEFWEKESVRHRNWMLVILALLVHKQITFEELDKYRIKYYEKQTKGQRENMEFSKQLH